ncbi:MAG: hypothetical protein NC115_02890 [Bacteroidales bacterium]|nr:hypothetical protein [Bacteroidales bacterium]
MKRICILFIALLALGCGPGRHTVETVDNSTAELISSGCFKLDIEQVFEPDSPAVSPGYGSTIQYENGNVTVRFSPEVDIICNTYLPAMFFDRPASVSNVGGRRYRIDVRNCTEFPSYRYIYVEFSVDRQSNICHGSIWSNKRITSNFKGRILPLDD